MGSLYQRRLASGKLSSVWWLKYHCDGKAIRESSRSTRKVVAKKLLEQREGEIAQGKVPGIYFDKVTFDELAEDFLADYRINGRKSLVRAERSVGHLQKHLAGLPASKIDTPKIKRYIEARLEGEAAPASVNRELSALKRMLNLGAKCTPPKIDRVPHIPMLKENNTRAGFFEHDEFLVLREALPDYLKGFVTFAYRSGWRLSEIGGLTWAQVDREQGIATLNPGETKNDAARTLYLDEELRGVIEHQWKARMQSERIIPYVFPNNAGTDRIRDFRGAWKKACTKAKIGKKLFHDFRRTSIRNMVRAGIPERVAMMVSGHKTRSVFDRYNIVSDDDLRTAAEKQAAYLNEKATSMGTLSGTLTVFPTKKELTR